MTATEYLGQARQLDQIIECHLREIENLKQLMTSISPVPAKVPKVSATRKEEAPFARALQRLIDLESEICDEIDRLVDLKQEIRGVIGQLRDPDDVTVLNYYYLQGMSFEEIGKMMCMDRSTARRRHDRAVTEIVVPVNATRIAEN